MKPLLQEILNRLPGSLGAAVVGFDGVPVEKVVATDDFNIDLASAEGIGVVRSAAAGDAESPDAPLQEITVCRSTRVTVLRSLGPDYYLCVVIGPEGIPGQARFEAWRAAPGLREAVA